MKIAVFGATGDTGRRICARILEGNDIPVAFSGSSTIVEGVEGLIATPINVLDQDKVHAAISGVDIVISAIGGAMVNRTKGLQNIIKASMKHDIQRLIVIGGAGILPVSSGERLSQKSSFPDFLQSVTHAHYQAYESLRDSDLEWTMICPGAMRAGNSDGTYRSQGELVLDNLQGVMYDDVAHLTLRCAKEGLYLKQRVAISNP